MELSICVSAYPNYELSLSPLGLPACSPQQSEVLAWDCCLCCPSSKRAGGRCLRGWTRGLLMLGAPGAQQCATLVLFPRTGCFDGLGSVEQLFKSQF